MSVADRCKKLEQERALIAKKAKLILRKTRIQNTLSEIEAELKKINEQLPKPNWYREIVDEAKKQLAHWPKEVRGNL